MVTMTDVAKYARVSKMTVSRVLSGNGYVKDETRQAVMEAVEALGYRPNLLAKGLATGRSNLIAYVMPDICDPFFGNVCKGISDVCDQRGFSSVVCNTASAASVENFINMTIDRKTDGVIFHHLCITQEQVDLLLDNGICVGCIDNEHDLEGVQNINNDNYNGAYQAAEYLISRGYRKILCIRGDLPEGSGLSEEVSYIESFQKRIWEDRTRGFLDALAAHGLEPFGICYGRGSADMDKAFLNGQQILKQIVAQPELPDAIYCESDLLALGVLGEMLEMKIDCPGTIALCGHDGLDTCRLLYPRITTVAQPQYELGQLAARSIIATIEGAPRQPLQILPSEIFRGDTTK